MLTALGMILMLQFPSAPVPDPEGPVPPQADRPATPPLMEVRDWIRQGEYRGKDGKHCCGIWDPAQKDCEMCAQGDCVKQEPGEVVEEEKTFFFPRHGIRVDKREVIPSEDGKWYVCVTGWPYAPEKKAHCVFGPVGGS